ncbi:MAG: hypothetical protein RPS47_11840 [Colwellia sp.]
MKYIHFDNQQSLVFSQTVMPEISADECLIKALFHINVGAISYAT